MPEAFVTVQERYKVIPPSGASRKRSRIHVGRDYVRWAKCEEHDRLTNDFVGVGDGLWVFVCTPNPRYRSQHHSFKAAPPSYDLVTPPQSES